MGGQEEGYRYDRAYDETVHLTDGQRVQLRLVRPSDKDMLREGFEHLSPDSRYARFMAPKSRLTERELQYLTDVDGVDHFAMGAIRRRFVSPDEGIGTARFVRFIDRPDTAEPAVTVLDAFQSKGLGSILLQRLIEAAWERDVRWFVTELLAENKASRRMIESLSPEVSFRHSGDGALVATLPVPEPDRTPTAPGFFAGTSIQKLLSYVARSNVSVRPRVTKPPEPPG
ncbi:MAG: GNAT family N-acetyltransferase [Deltaproteobacteria bacterium]|nr:GNAT family N-acetyltransferase [Deltaproteobacteria bacterium]